jgi:hypothetical protein
VRIQASFPSNVRCREYERLSERVIVDVPRRLDRAVDEAVEVAGTVSLTVHGGPGATETWIQGVDYPTYPSIECTKMTVVPLDHKKANDGGASDPQTHLRPFRRGFVRSAGWRTRTSSTSAARNFSKYRQHPRSLHHRCRLLRPQRPSRSQVQGLLTPQIKREFKRRAAIEPVIVHLKQYHHRGRNYLAHASGDAINAVLAAAGYISAASSRG